MRCICLAAGVACAVGAHAQAVTIINFDTLSGGAAPEIVDDQYRTLIGGRAGVDFNGAFAVSNAAWRSESNEVVTSSAAGFSGGVRIDAVGGLFTSFAGWWRGVTVDTTIEAFAADGRSLGVFSMATAGNLNTFDGSDTYDFVAITTIETGEEFAYLLINDVGTTIGLDDAQFNMVISAPLPGAAVLGLAGLAGVASRRRR